MRRVMRDMIKTPVVLEVLDLLAAPVGVLLALTGRLIRRIGVHRLPITLGILRRFGVFPIRDHYYEPLFNPAHLQKPLDEDRELSGIDWNVTEAPSRSRNSSSITS